MMRLKKNLLLLSMWLLLSCNQKNITIYDTNFEILHGRVRTLTEIFKNHDGIETHTTYFDKNGNAIKMLEIGGTCNKCELSFSYKYGRGERKKEVIMTGRYGQQPYACDSNGRIAEEKFDTKDYDFDKKDFAKKKEVFKYDARGYLKESASYDSTTRTYFTTHQYDSRGLLTKTNEFSGTMKKPYITVEYRYLILDKQGNWLKCATVLKYHILVESKMQETVSRDTQTRKITYY